jgi:perosamine synthetase
MVQEQQNLIKLASPDIKNSDIKKMINVLKSGSLVEGVCVAEFEDKLSKFTKIKNTLVVSSATAGLHLVLKALEIKQDDLVIVPTFTFPATANVVENIGANVVFCDVERDTYVIDPETLEKTIKSNLDKNLKAILVVHEFGYPMKMQKIAKIAKKYNLKLIEDAACALGTISDTHHVGYYSDGAVFSFHPRKAITSGEGGAIVSRNKELIEKIKVLKNHGIQRSDKGIDFVAAGLNYRMTDFQAALIIGQLDRFNKELKRRKKLVNIYYKNLSNIEGIKLPKFNSDHSWQSFMIVLDKKINREKIIKKLLAKGIQSNLGAQSLPILKYYNSKYNINKNNYQNSKILFEQGLVLPLYGKLNKRNIEIISIEIKRLIQE